MFEEPMKGCCPHVAGTEYENACLLGGICYGGASTCEYRRRTTCKNNYGEYCDKYDTCDCKDCEMTPPVDKDGCTGGYCSCKECQTKTECVALNCGELCPCRRDENKNFGDKEVSNAKAD